MEPFEIQSFSYEDRAGLLPALLTALADGGGWVLERRSLSLTIVELKVEAQLRSIVELYGAIISAGLELTRSSHLTLKDLCNCRKYAAGSIDPGQIVTLCLEVSFLEEISPHILMSMISPA